MSESIITPPKRIFVIGPMTKDVDDPKGLPLEDHIPNIVSAARNVLDRLGRERSGFPEAQVLEPPDIPGDEIPFGVFSHLFHCDFAIADISNVAVDEDRSLPSPNVIYELAMLHANGTPVLCLGEKIFYLNQSNSVALEDFSVEAIESVLAGDSFSDNDRIGPFERLVTIAPSRTSRNPITQFFGGAHLVNVAAAAGIATGYFFNFLSWVLKSGGVFSDPELDSIVLIRPDRLADVTDAVGKLDAALKEQKERDGVLVTDDDGNPVMEMPGFRHPDNEHPRKGYFVFKKGRSLFDYPTPISSLVVSRQVRAMGDYLQQEFDEGYYAEALQEFEKRLIAVYFDTLRDLARQDPRGCDWSRVKIMSVDEAIAFLST